MWKTTTPGLATSTTTPRGRSSRRRTLLRSRNPPLFPHRARKRKPQHGQENRNQSRRGLQHAALPLWQDREPSINKFDVHPIHQQRSTPELDNGAKTVLRKSPPAPRVNQKKNGQQDAAAHQEKIRTAVPVVVDGIQTHA